MKHITLIGWYLIVWLVFVAVSLCCCSCCKKTYESIVRDTLITERVDSVIVNMRDVAVEVPVPQITLEKWSPIDTLSVLDNGYYQSIVEVIDGQIHHILKPVAGSVIPATVSVADTTKVEKEKEKQVLEKQTEEKEQSQPVLSWWARLKQSVGSWTIALAISVLIISGLYFYIKRRKN